MSATNTCSNPVGTRVRLGPQYPLFFVKGDKRGGGSLGWDRKNRGPMSQYTGPKITLLAQMQDVPSICSPSSVIVTTILALTFTNGQRRTIVLPALFWAPGWSRTIHPSPSSVIRTMKIYRLIEVIWNLVWCHTNSLQFRVFSAPDFCYKIIIYA